MRRILLTTSLVLAFSASAFADLTDDDKNTARSLGQEAQEAETRGDSKTAEDRYHRAVQIFDNAKANVPATLLVGYARNAAKNSHFIAAEENYNRIIRAGLPPGAPPPFVKAFDDAKAAIDAVVPHIARVTITVTGCDSPSVTLDGAQISSVVLGVKKPVDPGTHEVKVSAAGCKASTTSFTVADGKEAMAPITLEKDVTAVANPTNPNPNLTNPTNPNNPNPTPGNPNPPDADTGSSGSGLRTAGWVTASVGAAGLILGAIFGGIALGDHSSLATTCANGCPASAQGSLDSYHTAGAVSTVGFIAGPVLIAAGLTMVFIAPSKKSAAASAAFIRPFFGLGSVGAFGQF